MKNCAPGHKIRLENIDVEHQKTIKSKTRWLKCCTYSQTHLRLIRLGGVSILVYYYYIIIISSGLRSCKQLQERTAENNVIYYLQKL